MAGFFDQAGGSLISGGASILGGLVQHGLNKSMMREQMRYQTAEREASQRYQTSEREAMQGYQTSERNAQNLWQESMYGKYYSPKAMVEQYNAAGINGKLAAAPANGQGLGTVAASSGSAGGAPSSGAPSGHSVSVPYQNVDWMSNGFANIAGALKSLGEAKRLGIETKYYEEMITEQLKGLKLGNETTELANRMNKVKLKYLEPKERAELDQKLQDLATGELKQSEISANIRWLKAKGLIAEHEEQYWLNKYHKEMALADSQIGLNTANTNLSNERVRTEKTQQRLNNSMTELNKAIKETEETKPDLNRAMRSYYDSLASIQSLNYDILESNLGLAIDAKGAELRSAIKVSEEAAKRAEIATRMAQRDADWQIVEKIVGITAQAVGTVFIGGKIVKSGAQAVQLLRNQPKAQIDVKPPTTPPETYY